MTSVGRFRSRTCSPVICNNRPTAKARAPRRLFLPLVYFRSPDTTRGTDFMRRLVTPDLIYIAVLRASPLADEKKNHTLSVGSASLGNRVTGITGPEVRILFSAPVNKRLSAILSGVFFSVVFGRFSRHTIFRLLSYVYKTRLKFRVDSEFCKLLSLEFVHDVRIDV